MAVAIRIETVFCREAFRVFFKFTMMPLSFALEAVKRFGQAPWRPQFSTIFGVSAESPSHFFLASLVWLAATQSAWGIVVFERGRSEATVGRLVRQDERSIVIEIAQPDGNPIKREILRSGIDELIVVVCEDRLAALRPENPAEYRDYAEELFVKRKDPDALETSIRLYLIAAYLAPETLGHSCLLAMIALARDPAEQRRFRAMAFLLDPKHDRTILKMADEDRSDEPSDEGRHGLLQAVRAIRRGQRRVALQWLERPFVLQELEKYQDLICPEQIRSLDDEIPPAVLRRLLVVEWLLGRSEDAGDSMSADRTLAWSQIARRRELAPIVPLTLETLTEFDPRESIYDHGRWRRP